MACVEMLLADRGILVPQDVIASNLLLPSSGEDLATRLNELSPKTMNWIGGSLNVKPPAPPVVLEALSETGSWAALLTPPQYRHGHWVVIDGFEPRAALVRDPVGFAYSLPLREFLELFGYLVGIFDRGGPR